MWGRSRLSAIPATAALDSFDDLPFPDKKTREYLSSVPIGLPCLMAPFLLQLRHGRPASFCPVRLVVQDSILA